MCINRCCHRFKPRIKLKGSFSKYVVEIYVRDLQNDMIKPYDNVGLASVVDYVT